MPYHAGTCATLGANVANLEVYASFSSSVRYKTIHALSSNILSF